jgi:hypothetical protein
MVVKQGLNIHIISWYKINSPSILCLPVKSAFFTWSLVGVEELITTDFNENELWGWIKTDLFNINVIRSLS